MTTPEADPVGVPADEPALRAELEDVRARIVDLWHDGDDATGREYAATLLGTFLLGVGLLMTGAGAFPADGYDDYDGIDASLLVMGLLMLAGAARAFRSVVLRRVRIYRGVRRLRRRERELVGLLPAGTAGPGSYRRYYLDRFGHPAVIALYALMFVVLLVILFAA